MNTTERLRNYKQTHPNNLNCVWHIGFAKNCDSIDLSIKQQSLFICIAIESCADIDIYEIFHGETPTITIDNECTDETKAVYIYLICE